MQVQGGSETKMTRSRRLRNAIDFGLPIIGTQIILTVLLFSEALPTTVYIVLGVIMVEIGIWKLAPRLLPDERKYHALRARGDQFLRLIRQLNTAALNIKANDTPENRQAVEDIRLEMHKLVDRMTVVAGKTDDELTTEYSLTLQDDRAEAVR